SAAGTAWPAWSAINRYGERPSARRTANGGGSAAESSGASNAAFASGVIRGSGASRAVRVVVDHPQSGPELEVEFVAFGVLAHQPRRRFAARHGVHDDVLVVHAAAVADLLQVERAGEGDALIAHARGGRADQQHVDAPGLPAGFLDQFAPRRRLQRVFVM